MITRKTVLEEAYHNCMSEMYAKAQPPANYDEIIDGIKSGTIHDSNHDPVYARHYLSSYEFNYILDKYKRAYGIESKWDDYVGVVERYFDGKGMRDVWVNETLDENGTRLPGYRDIDDVPNIKVPIYHTLFGELGRTYSTHELDELATKIAEHSINYLAWCKDFYRFDREAQSFSASIALGASPTSNPNTVIAYWKSQGVDIEIVERNPLLLWEMDEYGDEFEEYMIDEYGDDWEQYWKDEWEKRKGSENYGYDD